MLIAWFFPLLLIEQSYPLLVGPYESQSECAAVQEYLDRRGYETDRCGVLPIPQEAVLLSVPVLP